MCHSPQQAMAHLGYHDCILGLLQYLGHVERTYEMVSVYLCLDNDEAGHKANKRISDALFVKGIKHEILIPNRKDWNEDLLYPLDEQEEDECQALQL